MSTTPLFSFRSGQLCSHTHAHGLPLRFPDVQHDSFVSNGGVDKQSVSTGAQKTLMEMQESGESEKRERGGDRKTTTDISGNFTGMANPM